MTDTTRESYRALPSFLQPYLTWLSGVPHRDQQPVFRSTPVMRLLTAVAVTVLGIAVGSISIALWDRNQQLAAAALLGLSWMITVGGIRRLDVSIIHQALHYNVFESRLANRVLGEILTTLLLRTPFDENRKEHMAHHARPCVENDADVAYLRARGHHSNATKPQIVATIIRNILSLEHHASYLLYRLRSNYSFNLPKYRLLTSITYALVLLGVLFLTPFWRQLVFAWLIPLIFGFQVVVYVYTLSKHRWWLYDHRDRLSQRERDRLTFGRCCGDPLPVPRSALDGIRLWLLWWVRLFLVYTPYRLFLFVGDTVHHDLHHAKPACDWANSAYVRRDLMARAADRFELIWGGPLDHIFAAMVARANRDEDLSRRRKPATATL